MNRRYNESNGNCCGYFISQKRNTQERIHKIWKLCINLKLFLPVYLFHVSLIFHLLKGACGKEQHGGGADRLCPNGAFF